MEHKHVSEEGGSSELQMRGNHQLHRNGSCRRDETEEAAQSDADGQTDESAGVGGEGEKNEGTEEEIKRLGFHTANLAVQELHRTILSLFLAPVGNMLIRDAD